VAAAAGRGCGKTRTGAEMVRARVGACTARRLALVAPTAANARYVMVEGESGILAISPPWDEARYEPSKRRLTWPSGAIGTLYGADEPARLRGPQHDATWCNELGSWRYPEAWDMLMLRSRSGNDPRVVVTTTPRPSKLIRALIADPTAVVTRGSTYEYRTNLAPAFLEQIVREYERTRARRPGARSRAPQRCTGRLWSRAVIEAGRAGAAPALVRVVAPIDPAATSSEDADETGIILAGKDGQGGVGCSLTRPAAIRRC
jgi:phage terminase large subunit-like protein